MKKFPVLYSYTARSRGATGPKTVPWDFLAPHESQAVRNHSQSLKTLASRGGLCLREILSVVRGERWSAYETISDEEAEAMVSEHLRQWEAGAALAREGKG